MSSALPISVPQRDALARVAAAFSNKHLVAVLEDNEAKRFLINELVRRTITPALFIKAGLELTKYFLKFVDRVGEVETEEGLLRKLRDKVSPDGLVGRALIEIAELIESAELQAKLVEVLSRNGPLVDIPREQLTVSAHSPELKIALRVLANVERLASISDALQRLAEPQPALGLKMERYGRSEAVEDINDLIFTNRLTSFVGREEDIEVFSEFLNDERPVLWQVVVGRAGSGKSRLAMEFCLGLPCLAFSASTHGGADCWEAGFFIPSSLSAFNWSSWQPDSNKLIVIDNAAERAAEIRDLLVQMQNRGDIAAKVRFILLERSVSSSWWEALLPPLDDNTGLVEDIQWDEPYEICPLEDEEVWRVLVQTFEKARGYSWWIRENQSRVRRTAERMGALKTPLYAMIVGMHFANLSRQHADPQVRKVSIGELIDKLVDRERARWREAGLSAQVDMAAVIATLVSGIRPGEALAQHVDFDLYRKAIPSADNVAEPLTPDLLGEFFVLQSLVKLPAEKAKALVAQCWQERPLQVRAFAERCLLDFSRHPGLSCLRANPGDIADPKFLRSQAALDWFKLSFDAAHWSGDQNAFLDMLATMFRAMRAGFRPDDKLTARIIGRAPDSYGARRLFEAFEAAGLTMSTFHYNSLLRKAPIGRTVAVLESMRQRGIPFSEFTFCTLLLKGYYTSLDAALGQMTAQGVTATTAIFMTALKHCEASEGANIVSRALSQGVIPTNAMVDVVARKVEPAKAFNLFKEVEQHQKHVQQTAYATIAKANYALCREIIKHLRSGQRRLRADFYAMALEGAPDRASIDELREWMADDGRIADEVIFTVLMNRENYDGAVALFSEMQARGLLADEYVYAILIRKAGTVQEVRDWHAKAVAAGIELSPRYLSSLIHRLPSGDALTLLKEVEEGNLRLDAHVYATVFFKRDLTYEAKLALYEEMKTRGLEPDEAVLRALLKGASTFVEAQKLSDEMTEYGITRTASIYALLVGKTSTDEQLAKLEGEIQQAGLELGESILEALAWRVEAPRARQVLRQMKERGFAIQDRLFGHVLNLSELSESLRLLDDAPAFQITPNQEMYNIVLKKLARSGQPGVDQLAEKMRAAGHKGDVYTIMALILAADSTKVEGILQNGIRGGIAPDAPMIRLAIEKSEDFATAQRITNSVQKAGYTPDADVFAALARKGDRHQIDSLLKEMEARGLPSDARVQRSFIASLPFDEGSRYLETIEAGGERPAYGLLFALFKRGTYHQKLRVIEKFRQYDHDVQPHILDLMAQAAERFSDGVYFIRETLNAVAPVSQRSISSVARLAEDARQVGRLVRLLHQHHCTFDEGTEEGLMKVIGRLASGRSRIELRRLVEEMAAEFG